ncbi:DoxX family membrane protein [Aestuariirhabdus sp. Z084]|uniref:DoxX family membrane protein n=1 Tax=Aestuariirhabdus haliotis TaxID=2918751 RepID=UPI00201B4533|nr:DoxX family membrane protein [Aestuariirhabdus haliotis]MCL6417667.1 DoxX family membrane protein [Aestuariirhabdus haliotis]MCL6421606.1 DoxX family membrane protein [Aestuariirhabdus haliotis]
MNKSAYLLSEIQAGMAALFIRVGLGLVFVIGGTSKLSLLLGSSTHDAMVSNYMSTSGYINALFQEYLFTGAIGDLLSPAIFLTALSAFELISGIALILGLFVRPLSLFYGFLLWTFVIALPTMTVPGISLEAKTYTSPAIFVQIRDIALSGFMFVLYNLGSGTKSLDHRFLRPQITADWNALGLLLRLSLASVMIVGGFFGAFGNITSFATPQLILAITGILLIFGSKKVVQASSVVVMGVMLWYMFSKFGIDKTLIKNLNGFKREFALFASAGVLFLLGGGERYTLMDLLRRSKLYIQQFIGGGRDEGTLDLPAEGKLSAE